MEGLLTWQIHTCTYLCRSALFIGTTAAKVKPLKLFFYFFLPVSAVLSEVK